jgi:glycosyltransferase involved in cell wall biosynthesis
MKICMIVVNNFIHDARVYKEAKTLAQAGHEVTVFAMKSAHTAAHEQLDGFSVERIHLQTRQWPKWLFVQILKYLEFVLRVVARVRRQRPDVVHAHDINGLLPGWIVIVAGRVKAKLVYDSHEFWSERKSRLHDLPGGKALTRAVERFLIRRAHGVITVSASIVRELARRYAISPPVLVQNAQEFEQVQKTDVLRQRFGIPQDQHIAIYPGNLTPGRGLENVVRCVPHLDSVHIVIMGSDKMNGRIQQMARDLQVADKVHFVDAVPMHEVNQYVAAADVGIMCSEKVDLSYYYGVGNKLFHIVMAGIPLVVSDHPDKRNIVETHDVGIACDETDPRSIAQAFNHLLSDPERYEQLCANARRAARKSLNWGIEAQKLLSLYDRLVEP